MSRTIDIELVASVSAGDPLGGAIAVATDGTHDSDGAVRLGMELARRDGLAVALLSVVETMPFADDEGGTAADTERLTRLAIEEREGELAAQRARTFPSDRPWPHAIHVGNRVDEIVKHAAHHDASLIVLGLGSHGVFARLLHRETALRVIRTASIPVLAVPSGAVEVPRSAVVGIDFTPASVDAARAALAVLGGHGTLYFAHATPRIVIPHGESRPWGEPRVVEVLGRLEAVARSLDIPAAVQVEFVSLHGEPADELVAFAEQQHADMIVTGAHGRSAIGRLMLGSVSTKVVRSARCAVLVAP
ncbi:MAG TPA: universal stress protein [Gemmatimonadaceae bacterium]|nr:universal stress protein [Gemmatimonadaceae bacterium]